MSFQIWDATEANYIATNSTTPSIILHRLSQHTDLNVRIAVAENINTHPITALKLAQDSNPELRYALANNQQIDSGILNILAADKNPMIADRANKTLSRLKPALSGDYLPNRNYRFNSPVGLNP